MVFFSFLFPCREIIFTFIFKQKSTNLEMHVVAVLGGYFVYDLIESFGEWLKYKDTFIHHVIGAFLCYYIFLTEVSRLSMAVAQAVYLCVCVSVCLVWSRLRL